MDLKDAPSPRRDTQSERPLRFDLIENLALQASVGNEASVVQGARAGLEVAPTVLHDEKGEPLIAARIEVQAVKSRPRAPVHSEREWYGWSALTVPSFSGRSPVTADCPDWPQSARCARPGCRRTRGPASAA